MRTSWFFGALLSAIAFLPLPAQAQTNSQGPFDPVDTRIVSDPFYLPLKGEVYGATVYTLNSPKGDNFKAGVQTGSFQSSNNLIDQTLALGVARDFTIRAVMGYASNHRDSTSVATGDVTTGNSSGFSDPTFSATYRLLEQLRSPIILDLTASYSPNLIDATSSGGGRDGNVARGGAAAGFSLALGREMKAFTIAATATGTYVGRQTTELLSNATSTESDAHWNYDLGLNTQTRFSDRVSLNAGVAYGITGSYGVANVQTGNPRTSEGPDARSFNAAINCHLVPNRLVGAITYTYTSDTDGKNIFPSPVSDNSVQNRTGNVVGVRLMYVFN
jgi:hypothetical protein